MATIFGSGLSRHGAVRGWAAWGGSGKDRAIRGCKPEQRAWCTWLCPCLVRERRAGHGPHLPLLVAQQLSARRVFYGHLTWHLSLCEIQAAIGHKRCDCITTPSRSTGTAGGRNKKFPTERRFCGVLNWLAIRATLRLGAPCTAMRTAHCRGQAAGSPTCTSFWHRPS